MGRDSEGDKNVLQDIVCESGIFQHTKTCNFKIIFLIFSTLIQWFTHIE